MAAYLDKFQFFFTSIEKWSEKDVGPGVTIGSLTFDPMNFSLMALVHKTFGPYDFSL